MSSKRSSVVLAGVLVLVASGPSMASFHLMRIRQVMGGAGGDPTIQFVELQMASSDQTQLKGHALEFFDAAGNKVGSYTFPGVVANGDTGSSILIGTDAFKAVSTVNPDFIMPPGVMAPSGRVRFNGSVIDPSVSYGAYTGSMMDGSFNYVAPAPALPIDGVQALLRVRTAAPFNNSTDFVLADPEPTNNKGEKGKVVLPPPGGNKFLRGDCNGDRKVDLSDAVFSLAFQFVGGDAPPCGEACDSNSDGKSDLSDAIFVLTFLFLGGDPPGSPFPACDQKAAAACATDTCPPAAN